MEVQILSDPSHIGVTYKLKTIKVKPKTDDKMVDGLKKTTLQKGSGLKIQDFLGKRLLWAHAS